MQSTTKNFAKYVLFSSRLYCAVNGAENQQPSLLCLLLLCQNDSFIRLHTESLKAQLELKSLRETTH